MLKESEKNEEMRIKKRGKYGGEGKKIRKVRKIHPGLQLIM